MIAQVKIKINIETESKKEVLIISRFKKYNHFSEKILRNFLRYFYCKFLTTTQFYKHRIFILEILS